MLLPYDNRDAATYTPRSVLGFASRHYYVTVTQYFHAAITNTVGAVSRYYVIGL